MRTDRVSLLTTAEIRVITTFLSPAYVWESARAHGGGDAMAGAEAAYSEVRGAIRSVLGHAIARERRRIVREFPDQAARTAATVAAKREVRGTLEALGYRFKLQRVAPDPVATDWRATASAVWPQGYAIDGFCDVTLPPIPRRDPLTEGERARGDRESDRLARIARAVVRSISGLLAAHPETNRAVLDGRVWRRTSAEVLVYAELAPDQIEPLVVDASVLSDDEAAAALRSSLRAAVRTSRHPLAGVGASLTRAWCQAGFLASPGGASISDCTRTGITHPLPALIPGQGVPLAVAIGTPRDGVVTLGIRADHRAGDAGLFGEAHKWLRLDVPKLLAAA